MYSRIDVHLWVIDQCHAKPWGPCISIGSYCSKVYLWLSEAYWRELPCTCGSERPHSAVPEISADQCPALINWYLDEYWLLWHVLGIVRKVFLRAFRRILDRVNRASICGVMAKWSLWQAQIRPCNWVFVEYLYPFCHNNFVLLIHCDQSMQKNSSRSLGGYLE